MTDSIKQTSPEEGTLKKYFTVEGRASRSEYWAMVIITLIVTVTSLTLLATDVSLFMVIGFVAILTIVWYSIATTVRRLNDCGLSAWWIIASFIPWVNTVFTIVIGCLKSKDS